MKLIGRSWLALSLGLMFQSGPAGAQAKRQVDFQREVRPILSDACFACHGPDKGTRMADLRLDTREDATAPRKNGAAIVPGKPEASLLWKRIVEEKPARRMPPPYSHKTLTSQQREVLKRWIEQGAPWREHWSFVPPVRPALPPVKRKDWVRTPIDRFILARLEAANLSPAPEADRRTLARRVALDLTGLPPRPEEVEAFVNNPAPDAYEKLIDRYLSSPRYGEHRAKYWLDAARYADTHGIHVDNYREMWPYRDWVIKAFNRNLPFDVFTIEQLAGDLLPDRTLDQQIASGFHRCNVTTNEAGVIIEEVEAIYAKDRADTTGAVFLGLTVGCASCHDHKFDPISMKDFYSLTAFFRNTTQNAMDGNIPDTPPVVVVPRDEDRERWLAVNRNEAAVREALKQRLHSPGEKFAAWLREGAYRRIVSPLAPGAELTYLAWAGEQVEALHAGRVPLREGVTVGESPVPGQPALRFAKGASLEIPRVDALDGDRAFSLAVWFFFPTNEDTFVLASQSDPNDKGRGWTIEIGARVSLLRLAGDEGKAITIRAGHLEQLKAGTWNHLVFTYDGSREQPGLNMFLNGRAIPTQGRGDQNTLLQGSLLVNQPLRLGGDGKRFFENGAIADFRIFNRALTEEEALVAGAWPQLVAARAKTPEQLSADEREALHRYFLLHNDQPYQVLGEQLAAYAAEKRAIRQRGAITHVMEEKTDSQPFAHILHRGQYDQPRERVEAGVPSALPPMPASFPRNRLGLARWLVDSANPLTSRVTVNRFWQEVFGTGLVKTSEDFGSQGEPPSHPELLDWLAVEFRESGWDVKRLFKLMLMSSAYRQAALTTPDKLEKDPDNRLLSRGPRFRMEGEMIRDYALAASGLLSPAVGGPSVKPYQPDGIWEAVAMVGSNTRFYKRDQGEPLYRRSLYWFWKRSAPPASMEIFNAPTRESCTVRRERTNTPLQALVTMNDPQFVEAARVLAERTLREGGADFDQRLDFLTARLISRPLDERERAVARRAYQDYLRFYDSQPAEAAKLLSVGELPADARLPKAEFAAFTMVANQMMNLDEVLNK
jgi:hypothetical protein